MLILTPVFLLVCFKFIIMDAKSILLYVAVGLVLAAIVVAIVWCIWLAVKARRYQYLKELYSFVNLVLRRGDWLFCVSHHPLVLVDEKGMEFSQFHGKDELFRFGKIRENSVLPDVCYALKIGFIGINSVFFRGTEYKLFSDAYLKPAEYSDRWRVEAVEGNSYCFVHPVMGKLKLPQTDFPELKVGEWVVLKQVIKCPWWALEHDVSYQFVKK